METWKHNLVTASMDITETMALQADITHSFQQKRKAIYVEWDAQFIIKAFMEETWSNIPETSFKAYNTYSNNFAW